MIISFKIIRLSIILQSVFRVPLFARSVDCNSRCEQSDASSLASLPWLLRRDQVLLGPKWAQHLYELWRFPSPKTLFFIKGENSDVCVSLEASSHYMRWSTADCNQPKYVVCKQKVNPGKKNTNFLSRRSSKFSDPSNYVTQCLCLPNTGGTFCEQQMQSLNLYIFW